MKKQIIIIFISLHVAVYSQAPVYLNLGSHNETNDPLQYRQVYADYELAKSLLLQLADTVIDHNARWNMQIDANFIRGCIAHDTARTNPNNFIKWADDLVHIEVDPHNHFQPPFINPYNPTDLNHLLVDSCLLGTDRNNLGGFTWTSYYLGSPCAPTMQQDWFHYNSSTENGFKFPGEQWRPVVLWGGGSPGHCDDSNAMGLWKPTDTTTTGFYMHAPSNYETVIGSNCGTQYVIFDTTNVQHVIDKVIEVINYAQTVGNPTTDFYTLTVMFNFRNIDSPNMVDKLAEFIRSMDGYVSQGKVVWATLTEKYDIWHASHTNNDSFVRLCDDMNLGEEVMDVSEMLIVYPNPVNRLIKINYPIPFTNSHYYLYDLTGKIFSEGLITKNEISIDNIANGMYFLMVEMDGKRAIKKIQIQSH